MGKKNINYRKSNKEKKQKTNVIIDKINICMYSQLKQKKNSAYAYTKKMQLGNKRIINI